MRHLIVTHHNPIARPRTLVLPVALSLLVLALSGCGPYPDDVACPHEVALQAPGVTPVLTANVYPEYIGSILPYLDASGDRHALLLGLGVNVRLSSSGSASEVSDDLSCGGVAAWTSDHREVFLQCGGGSVATLCFAPDGTVTATLTAAIVTTDGGYGYVSADWWPNSRVLTLVRTVSDPTSNRYSIDFYVLDRTASHLSLTGRVYPEEARSACPILQDAWSPDGQELALLTPTSVQVLSRSALPATVFAPTSPPVTAAVTPRTLPADFTKATWIAWRPHTLAVTVADGTTIQQVTVPDGQRSTLLTGTRTDDSTVDDMIGSFAWWPDGHHLLFAYGYGQGSEWVLGASRAPINSAAVPWVAQPAVPIFAANTSCALPPPVLYQAQIA